ncbi:MAG: RadC family protein [Caulobacterales bacterium]
MRAGRLRRPRRRTSPAGAQAPPAPKRRSAKAARGQPAPHYQGHRDRLRQCCTETGAGALSDYELLELIRFRAAPRIDTKPLAKALIARFGDLAEVFAAEAREIQSVDGAGAGMAAELKAIQAVIERIGLIKAKARPAVSSGSSLGAYCQTALQHEAREQVRVFYLDAKSQIIRHEVHSTGTVSQSNVYPREIVRRALKLSAVSLTLVHNHPSCDSRPSAADVEITHARCAAAKTMGISVHDHLVIGRNGTASFKALRLI